MTGDSPIEIIYNSDVLVAINKPPGMMVHRTPLARDAKVFAVQSLRNQIDRHVYPLHRLDRKTSGVLLFSKAGTELDIYYRLFRERKVNKTYHAIVRGFLDDAGTIDYALLDSRGIRQEAVTDYRTLERYELGVPFGKYQTSRYSYVELKPLTGRMHQLRRHMAHIFHPIIGDRPHGCNKQNRLWKSRWGMDEMLLHARALDFVDPESRNRIEIVARGGHAVDRVEQMLRTTGMRLS